MSVTKSASFTHSGKTYTCTLTLSGTWNNAGNIRVSISPSMSVVIYLHGHTGGQWVLEAAGSGKIPYDENSPVTRNKAYDCISVVLPIGNGNFWDRNDISGNCFIIDFPQSGTPTVTRQLPKLPAPTGLTYDQVTSSSARVDWNSVENASGYKVEYRRQGDTTWNE